MTSGIFFFRGGGGAALNFLPRAYCSVESHLAQMGKPEEHQVTPGNSSPEPVNDTGLLTFRCRVVCSDVVGAPGQQRRLVLLGVNTKPGHHRVQGGRGPRVGARLVGSASIC